MKIAHISDLHISSDFKRANIRKTKKLLNFFLENNYDHLVITGDITDNADAKDFQAFRKILQSYGLLDTLKCSVVIGNHDIYGGVQTAMDVVQFPNKCKTVDFDTKVKEFCAYFEELFFDTLRPDKESYFPYAKDLGDVVLVGLNSIDKYSRLKNPFASNGRVNDIQLEYLSELLEHEDIKKKRKTVLIHHHFYKKTEATQAAQKNLWSRVESFALKLRGRKKLLKVLSGKHVDYILHGHSHEKKIYDKNGITFLNAGASVDNHKQNEASLYVIDYPEDGAPHYQHIDIHISAPALVRQKLKKVFIPRLA